jgi:aminoglycoside phosphotransferase (APT) family kinase protein
MHEALVGWCAATLGAEPTGHVERIGTGHSRAMLRVTFGDGRRVVVRMEQGGVFGTSGAEEARVMRALRARGVPVADIVAEEPTGTITGRPFFVMSHIDGAEAAASGERDVDDVVAASFVSALAGLHRVDTADPLGFDIVPASPDEATPGQVERWRSVYRAASPEPIPLLEMAAAWLHHHAPPLDRLAVVHGDAGPGNFVHDGSSVVALTDFEFCHLGDPAEDWSFCLAMRGARTMARQRWLDLFAASGFTMSEERWRYWEAFNLFKGACANRTCLALFESGANRAPNMAIIGTTLHQVFLRRLVDLTASA